MTPNLPPVLPGFSEPVMGPLKVIARGEEQKDVACLDDGEWSTNYFGNIAEHPYSLRLGSPIARANGIGREEIPAGLPPLPPVPKGYDRWEYRGKGYDSSDLCVYAGFFEQYPEDGWRGIPDAPETLRGNVDAHYIEAVRDYKFRNVSCSQCGGEFGPGDHGFSHCADHYKQEQESDEQGAFEHWLERVCPSGDHDSVQRQWLASSDYADFLTESQPTSDPCESESPKPDEGAPHLPAPTPPREVIEKIREREAKPEAAPKKISAEGFRQHLDEMLEKAPTPPKPEDQVCDLPPAGWYCTREAGHEGPCAAVELSSKTPRTDAALIPVHGVATDYVDAVVARQLESDLAAARAIFPKICDALGNGACCTSDASIEFLSQIPDEVRLVIEKKDTELKRLRAALERTESDLRYFVDRCEAGTARSVTTQTRYRDTIEFLKAEKAALEGRGGEQ